MTSQRKEHYVRHGAEASVVINAEDRYLEGAQDFQIEMATNRALTEAAANFDHLHHQVTAFRKGTRRGEFEGEMNALQAQLDNKELLMAGHQVMQAWEVELMKGMVRIMMGGQTVSPGDPTKLDILEVGFGMSISATEIMNYQPANYHVIEPNPDVIKSFETWSKDYKNVEIKPGYWEDVIPNLGSYDGIFYDPYVFCDDGREFEHMVEFFPVAAQHLNKGGALVYFTCEIDTVGRPHQREIFKHFSRISIEVVNGLEPPEGCQYWWSDSMAVVAAIK